MPLLMSFADIRRSYDHAQLDDNALGDDPLAVLVQWVNEARTTPGVIDPTAMTLATVNARGQPSARTVLLKACNASGLVFYTHYDSRKGHELADNPRACLLFYWPGIERQIRAEGTVSKVSADESDAYFYSRPAGSRLGAYASPQSQPITRAQLEHRLQQAIDDYGDHPPRPENWGGYRLVPDYLEFWQGRRCRLHDRIVYQANQQGSWARSRLAP